jgi:hypothetical protein
MSVAAYIHGSSLSQKSDSQKAEIVCCYIGGHLGCYFSGVIKTVSAKDQ